MNKLVVASTVAFALTALSAHATTLSGVFTVDVYNYDAGGVSANARASEANIAANVLRDTFIYTGELDFRTATKNGPEGGTPSIGQFLATGGGIVDGLDPLVAALDLSMGQEAAAIEVPDTTILDFRAISLDAPFTGAFSGTISHDDGFTLLENAVVTSSFPNPTSVRQTTFDFFGGDFRIVYAAANGDPSVLKVDATPVPLPAPLALLLAGIGGLGLLKLRRKAS